MTYGGRERRAGPGNEIPASSCSQAGPGGAPGKCLPFNPFTTTPVEHVNWEKGPRFGQAINPLGFQQPRTYRFSVGIRF
ncbi:MAG TPA: hypothetical protein VOA87_09415 [Thermoanaerobaculia bacterium]|nr:hypothetical protein [Thermoanaerobaculia bacterium]